MFPAVSQKLENYLVAQAIPQCVFKKHTTVTEAHPDKRKTAGRRKRGHFLLYTFLYSLAFLTSM